MIDVLPTALVAPILPETSTFPAPELIVRVFVPAALESIVPTTPTAPPFEAMVVLPKRSTAPVRVTVPAVASLLLTTAVVIVPSVVIVPPVMSTSLMSELAPIFLILTVPVVERVISVVTPPSVPTMSPANVMLPAPVWIVRSAASASVTVPVDGPALNATARSVVLKSGTVAVRLKLSDI